MLEVGSLFSGIGGIELGLERAGGFRTAWFVEREAYAAAVLRRHWPATPVHGDITQLDPAALPRVDVLTGGFPCQDISNAGKRAGIEGARSGLWKDYVRFIRVLRPRYVIAENVAALVSRGLDVVLSDFASLGYDAEWYCVPAAAVGAPHRRDRIFILAYANDGRGQGEPVRAGRDAAFEGCEDAADADGKRMRELQALPRVSLTWSVEPDVGRVAHGVPSRVDRIKCLGNAVVPQVAQAIGEAIMNEVGRT